MLPPVAGGNPGRLVVLLHGYGTNGNDLIGLGMQWRSLLPDALFISPDAPEEVPNYPMGRQWFSLDAERPVARLVGLPAVRPVMEEFLKDLWSQTGLTARDTLLVGFSQGAMVALHVGLALTEPLMGIVAFSGALVAPENFPAARTPICLVHGDSDTVVDPQLSAEAEAVLRAAGFAVHYHVSPDAGHGIAPDGLAFAEAFIVGVTAEGA
jgi:phospholipase/carboxylesterase